MHYVESRQETFQCILYRQGAFVRPIIDVTVSL